MKSVMNLCAAVITSLVVAAHAGEPPVPPGVPGLGRPQATPSSAAQLVKVQLLADTETVAPGATFHLAVAFSISPGWHIYWEHAGDAGTPTEFEVNAPEGFTVHPPRYPRPLVLAEPDGTVYGYEEETVIFIPVTAPKTLDAGPLEFGVDVFFLVCRSDVCVIGRETRPIRLTGVTTPAPSTEPAVPAPPADSKLARFWHRLPRPLDTLPGAKVTLADGALVITGRAPVAREIAFLPVDTDVAWFDPATVVVDDDGFRIRVPLELRWQNTDEPTTTLRGVVAFGDQDGPAYQVELPVDAPEPSS